MPRRRPSLKPRKRPRQARSRDTVEAILAAAAYILRRSGYEAMTTNQIAERAGVNIASLYQYFPNKASIVAELMRRHVEHARAGMLPALERSRGADTATRIRALVQAMADEHAVEPELHAVFTRLGPQLGVETISTDVDGALAREGAAWIDSVGDGLPDPELSLWIARTAIHAVFHAAFAERPDVASSPALVDELVRLVTTYLRPGGE